MALPTSTIGQLTLAGSINNADLIEIERASDGLSRKVTRETLLGATLTGGGVLATGGFTLTVPATGTAALLATAQTFSALKTFGAGLTFGDEVITVYDEGTWFPAITGSTSDPTITYTSQIGQYRRINNWVDFRLAITINTVSGGSGTVRISLPFAVAASSGYMSALTHNVDWASGSHPVFNPNIGQSYGTLGTQGDNIGVAGIAVTGLAASDEIHIQGSFQTS